MIVALLTFVVFAPAIRFDYLQYDDGVYVYENAVVLKGLSVEGVVYAFRTIDGGSWMPMTWLSLMLDQSLFGNQPWAHHLTNVLLHSLCAALLFLAFQKMTGWRGGSWFVAVAFAIHPLRTESVAWIAERKDVLSGMMWMFGLLAYSRYVKKPGLVNRLRVVVCLVLGLMSKPMLVTFPFVLLLLDVWPFRRVGSDWRMMLGRVLMLVREKAWLLVVVALFCGLTYWAQDKGGAVSRPRTSVGQRATFLAVNYGFYLEKHLLPTDRTVLYPEVSQQPARVAISVGVLVIVSALAFWGLFRAPWLAVGWFWFLGTLIPVIGIVRIGYSTVADRYTYLPSIGLFIIAMCAVRQLTRERRWVERLFAVVAVMVLGLMVIATENDLSRWKDSGALFRSAVNVSPHRVALNNLANFQIGRGEYSQAIESCDLAIAMYPDYGPSYGNRSLAYAWLDDYEQAKADYDHAVRLGTRPIQPMHNRVGSGGENLALPVGNNPEESWHLFANMFKLEPKSAESFRGRADMRAKSGDNVGAMSDYNSAIRLDPAAAQSYIGRGNIRARAGNWREAIADMSKAIELSPASAETFQNRAVLYFKAGDFTAAWADIEQCRKLGGTPHESFIRALTEVSGRSR